MKRLFSYLMGGCLLAACAAPQHDEISGELTDLDADSIIVYSYPFGSRSQDDVKMDTIAAPQGKFVVNVGDSVVKGVTIRPWKTPVPDADGKIRPVMMKGVNFILVPGAPLTLTGTLDNYTLGGSPVYEAYNTLLTQLKPYEAKIDSVNKLCMDMGKQGVGRDSIMQAYAPVEGWQDEMEQIHVDFVKQHADQDAALLALLNVRSTKSIHELLGAIAEPVRTGVLSSLYDVMKTNNDKAMAREAAKEKIKEGAEAPDFTLKDINGKDFTLSSLRGNKYVVLDFWGSWCGWCIKGMPDMKKYYEKYKNKLEIVGIDCNDTEDSWKAAVETHALPWIHVRNAGDPDISVMYAIEGYPTKIVLDKEGKIAKVVVGEDPEFYKYLDSLLK